MKISRSFQLENIISFIIWFIAASSTISKTNGTAIVKPPQMWLSLHKSEPQMSHPIKLGHKTDYVFESNLYPAYVTCEAEYPITVKFPHLQDALEFLLSASVSNYRFSNWNNKSMTPFTTKFMWTMYISLPNVTFLNFNVTCAPVDRNIKISETSLHIYLKGEKSFKHQGKTIHISALPTNNPPLVLPCRPANPNLKVVLEKNAAKTNTKQQVWKRLNILENNVTFDPKIGFTFQKALDKNSFGLYKCSIENATQNPNQDPFFILKVTKITSSSIARHQNFVPRSILAGNASAGIGSYDGGNRWQIKCCSGIQDKPPLAYIIASYNRVTSQVLRITILSDIAAKIRHPLDERYRRNDCYQASALTTFVTVITVCKGENIDFVEEYTNVFRPSTRNISDKTLKDKLLFDNAAKSAEFQKPEIFTNQFLGTADIKTAPVSQKILFTVLQHITGDPNQLAIHPHTYCDTKFISTAWNLHTNNIGELFQYDRDVYYEGEKMIFMCLGGKMLYANGGYLRLNWKNGTSDLLELRQEDHSIFACDGCDSKVAACGRNGTASLSKQPMAPHKNFGTKHCAKVHLSRNTRLGYEDATAVSRFGTAFANPEMASVECWMPQVDGKEWDKISKNLTILPGVAPKFAEMENQVVNFSEREKWKFLICTVNQGLPLPIVNVTKDGLPVKTYITHDKKFQAELLEDDDIVFVSYRRNINNEKSLTVLIIFPEIKSNHHGAYQCTASNIKKTVTRTMKVSVIDNTSTANTNNA